MFDVIILGGGPAGLSAAVNAAAEGLDVALIAKHLGGQAGTSSRIENYAGFPEGIAGPNLIDRFCRQAQKFGALLVKGEILDIETQHDHYVLIQSNGTLWKTKTVILACGVQYNEPEWAKAFAHSGVHYSATPSLINGLEFKSEDVAVIGGGNSAGQAANYLSKRFPHVHMLIRGKALSETMSDYLLERIQTCDNITVHTEANTTSLWSREDGVNQIGSLTFTDPAGEHVLHVRHVFPMIGARPNCKFQHIEIDDKGFITTSPTFETSCPGIFAVGDIRSGNVKRVANAAGEGAAVIQHVFHAVQARS